MNLLFECGGAWNVLVISKHEDKDNRKNISMEVDLAIADWRDVLVTISLISYAWNL